ncbi:MAG: DUF2867 domain-containing protein [Anaerolineae bacterium]
MTVLETNQTKDVWRQVPEIAELVADADHLDVKTFEGEVNLREFLANMLSYYPGWIRSLYRVRWFFVRMLGMKQTGVPQMEKIRPEDLHFTAGESAGFFEVKAAAEGHFYMAGATESHLTAHLGVVREPLSAGASRYHVLTIVHYHSWAGPVYFNVIRPFHHLVVNQMGKAGIGGKS